MSTLVWNVAELCFMISFGAEVVEVIEYDFGHNPVGDALVILTLIAQNVSLWYYIRRRPDCGFWNSVKAIAMAFISVSITSAVADHIPNGWVDTAVTVAGIIFLNVVFQLSHHTPPPPPPAFPSP